MSVEPAHTARREAWIAAATEVTAAMLSGVDESEALRLIARRSREIADAAVAALVLPGWGGQWVLEVADGPDAAKLIGTVMRPGGRATTVIASGSGTRVDDLSGLPTLTGSALGEYGPALYAPLISGPETMGALLLARELGQPPFTAEDQATAERFASQAALALRLAESRRRAEELELLHERQRIARDLHDLVIQELFAMGMGLSQLRPELSEPARAQIDASLESLERAVAELRATTGALRSTDQRSAAGEHHHPPNARTALTQRITAEARRARAVLGFDPQVTITVGEEVALSPEVLDDMVAVVREGLANAARHAAARRVQVTVRARQHDGRTSAEVRVQDDGCGLPSPGSPVRRSGLTNLAERAQRHGGECRISAAEPRGTLLHWRV